MKIILDESVPQKLRLLIEGGHTVVTTWYQGWSGLKNGALLTAAEGAGFDLMAVLVLSTNNWDFVKAGIAEIMAAISGVTPGSYTEVEIPE